MVTMVELVLEKLGVNHCVMMGVGMGGYLALSVALNTPTLVDGLILINTSSGNLID